MESKKEDTGQKILLAFGGLLLVTVTLFSSVILGTLGGAFVGWVVSFVFNDTMLNILGQLGIHNIAFWQFGAFMGFLGGFLRTKVTVEPNKG